MSKRKILFLSMSIMTLFSIFFYAASVSKSNANTAGLVYSESKFLDDVDEVYIWTSQTLHLRGYQDIYDSVDVETLNQNLDSYIEKKLSKEKAKFTVKTIKEADQNPYRIKNEKKAIFHFKISHQKKNINGKEVILGSVQLLVWRPLPSEIEADSRILGLPRTYFSIGESYLFLAESLGAYNEKLQEAMELAADPIIKKINENVL